MAFRRAAVRSALDSELARINATRVSVLDTSPLPDGAAPVHLPPPGDGGCSPMAAEGEPTTMLQKRKFGAMQSMNKEAVRQMLRAGSAGGPTTLEMELRDAMSTAAKAEASAAQIRLAREEEEREHLRAQHKAEAEERAAEAQRKLKREEDERTDRERKLKLEEEERAADRERRLRREEEDRARRLAQEEEERAVRMRKLALEVDVSTASAAASIAEAKLREMELAARMRALLQPVPVAQPPAVEAVAPPPWQGSKPRAPVPLQPAPAQPVPSAPPAQPEMIASGDASGDDDATELDDAAPQAQAPPPPATGAVTGPAAIAAILMQPFPPGLARNSQQSYRDWRRALKGASVQTPEQIKETQEEFLYTSKYMSMPTTLRFAATLIHRGELAVTTYDPMASRKDALEDVKRMRSQARSRRPEALLRRYMDAGKVLNKLQLERIRGATVDDAELTAATLAHAEAEAAYHASRERKKQAQIARVLARAAPSSAPPPHVPPSTVFRDHLPAPQAPARTAA